MSTQTKLRDGKRRERFFALEIQANALDASLARLRRLRSELLTEIVTPNALTDEETELDRALADAIVHLEWGKDSVRKTGQLLVPGFAEKYSAWKASVESGKGKSEILG